MTRVRFAPSPTGSLHVGSALSAVANRNFGGTMLLRIDDTDAARNVTGGEEAIIADLAWLGIRWDEGPVRQSERAERHREAAREIGAEDGEGAIRFGRLTLVRGDGSPTYQLASAVDDVDFRITHVIRGSDHRDNTLVQTELIRALGAEPPEFVHHGLILGEGGQKLSKREGSSSIADLREAGIPAEAVRRYLDELDLPKHDVHLDLKRIRRLAVDVIAELSDEELAARVGAPVELVPALRGARDLVEARDYATQILEPLPVRLPPEARPTLERFKEIAGGDGRDVVGELQAVHADLKALRLALTGRDHGPQLASILAALPSGEALRRVDAALAGID